MERLFQIMIVIASIILLGMAFYYFYVLYQAREITQPNNSIITPQDAEKGVFYAIAIDLDGNNEVTAQTIAEGKDAVLMVKPDSKVIPVITSSASKPDYYIFNGAKSLYEHDHNFDGWIKQDDLIYKDLLVVTLMNNKQLKAIPLIDSGIEHIHFNADYLDLIQQGKDAPAFMTIGFVTGVTGPNRILKIIPLPVKMFE